MFRDEGTEPSIQFRQRMDERVCRTPTSLILVALPFLLVARIAIIAHHHYAEARCASLSSQIDAMRDLRTTVLH